MKISTAALLFLILAAALGPPIHGSPARESLEHGLQMALLKQNPSISHEGMHRATDCCFSYTPRNIRCVFMEDYHETSSGCSRPAVIFTTKRGQRVCADPFREGVQDCVEKMGSESTPEKWLLEELVR
ncbi:C-C motif chemokine 15-like [Desmodus rotundus]|uniref:C-C motif chemokine 15-like n=1 Tax=Desmodus rotundus TaxID=9430 RepID=UPI0023810F17|nr:C-C motif chemokine 15-like [Desmodus rotundus]